MLPLWHVGAGMQAARIKAKLHRHTERTRRPYNSHVSCLIEWLATKNTARRRSERRGPKSAVNRTYMPRIASSQTAKQKLKIHINTHSRLPPPDATYQKQWREAKNGTAQNEQQKCMPTNLSIEFVENINQSAVAW